MNSPKISIITEYEKEFDKLSPKFKDMTYPGVVIISGKEMIIFSYDDLDILFSRVLTAKLSKESSNGV